MPTETEETQQTERTSESSPKVVEEAQDDARDILNFDPFAPGVLDTIDDEKPAEKPAEKKPAAEAKPKEEPVTEPKAPEVDPSVAALIRQNELIEEQNRLVKQTNAQAAATQHQQQQAPKEDPIPSYEFAVEDALVNAIRGENPEHAKAAVAHLIKEIGTVVHRNVREEYRNYYNVAVKGYVNAQIKTQANENQIERDFFGAHPDLATSQGRQLVVTAAQQVLAEEKYNGWTAETRDEIARRARAFAATIADPGGQSTAPAAAQQKQNGKKKQVKQATPTTRPAAAIPDGQENDVVDTLFGSG